jgi:hypothetical protein
VNWVHPPYRMISQVILHMQKCQAGGTVVVPWWEKAAWWPLVRQGEGWAGFVKEAKCLGPSVKLVGYVDKGWIYVWQGLCMALPVPSLSMIS